MISVERLYNDVNRIAAKDQKGYNMPDDFNGDLWDAQRSVAETIYTFLERNVKAIDILSPLMVRTELTSNSTGVITKPTDYLHELTLEFKVAGTPATYYPMEYYGINGVAISKRIPQRAANASKNRYRYSFQNDKIQVYPEVTSTIRLDYLKTPPDAVIAFTENTSGSEDYLVYDAGNSINLVWPESCYNLFLALLLEKLGVAIKDQVLMEYSQLGFNREIAQV